MDKARDLLSRANTKAEVAEALSDLSRLVRDKESQMALEQGASMLNDEDFLDIVWGRKRKEPDL